MKNAGEDLEVYVRIAIARSTNRVLRGRKGDFKFARSLTGRLITIYHRHHGGIKFFLVVSRKIRLANR